MSTTRLQGKVAVVTGASRGIGAALARLLDDQGVRLGLASRSGADLGIGDAVASPCDVRDPAQVEALVSATSAPAASPPTSPWDAAELRKCPSCAK